MLNFFVDDNLEVVDVPEKDKKLSPLVIIALVSCAVLFVSLIVLIVIVNTKFKVEPRFSEEEVAWVAPSEVLANRDKYAGKELIIRGRVSQEPVVCERKECPEDDSCCGCRIERNLLINDAEKVSEGQSSLRLRMLDLDNKALCQRRKNSCEYDCPGWEIAAVYDVSGTFFAQPPPRGSGLNIYMDFYFQKKAASLVKKGGIADFPARVTTLIKELIKNLRGSSSFYLAP